jgi:16S rRNA processing protein RimM
MLKDRVSIGKIVATHGTQGACILKHGLGGRTDFNGVPFLMIEVQKGSFIPYFILSAKAKSASETLITFEGLINREEAQKLLQKNVWVSEPEFNKLVKPDAIIALMGYSVVEDGKPLGFISEIIEQPHQVLCAVVVEGKEALIPLNESTLVKIDRKGKKVFVSLPEGLLDIYLQ